jgi:hypothetical protein
MVEAKLHLTLTLALDDSTSAAALQVLVGWEAGWPSQPVWEQNPDGSVTIGTDVTRTDDRHVSIF